MDARPWAILDFADPDGRTRREVFRDPIAVLTTRDLSEVRGVLDQAETMAATGHHVVGFVAYDAAPAFEPAFALRGSYSGPLAWFAAFPHSHPDEPRPPSDRATADAVQGPAPEKNWKAAFDAAGHRAKVADIIEGIGRGDFYQVNLTARFEADVGDPVDLYERLRAAQHSGYFSFIDTGEMQVVSVSPELFVRRSGSTLESRPMKGTAARGRWPAEDDARASALQNSEKERAENVMIVDLIRNDMGRIAVPGTVEVPSMFTIEKYPTVLQMTSHVKSQLPVSTTLTQVFAALFPCGSVTGAPKIAASKSIAAVEDEPRGNYCGAIGVIRPSLDFVFNVAIRTLTIERGHAVYGAGGGITADSDPTRELDELFAKAAVLTGRPETFGLIETMRLEDRTIPRLDRHLARLVSSARYFGLDVARLPEARAALLRAAAEWTTGTYRVRLALNRDGSYEVTGAPFRADLGARRMGVASAPVDSRDRLLYHKISDRTLYSDRLGAHPGLEDVILTNERGEVTETTIGNLVAELDGQLVTPPIDSGLLPGVLREELLEAGTIREQVLYPEDLPRASRLWMINSLRGWVEARLA